MSSRKCAIQMGFPRELQNVLPRLLLFEIHKLFARTHLNYVDLSVIKC